NFRLQSNLLQLPLQPSRASATILRMFRFSAYARNTKKLDQPFHGSFPRRVNFVEYVLHHVHHLPISISLAASVAGSITNVPMNSRLFSSVIGTYFPLASAMTSPFAFRIIPAVSINRERALET